jgi:hypothetical protein
VIRKKKLSEACRCAPGANNRGLVTERADVAERGEGADGVRTCRAAEVRDPVIEVILDAGAANEQRQSVDYDSHFGLRLIRLVGNDHALWLGDGQRFGD